MRVLVTGGAGYVGSHAARALRRRGHEVTVYDNLSTGHEWTVHGFEFVRGDIGDAAALRRTLHGADAVMHFAALIDVGESVREPRKYFDNNVLRALTLLNASMDAGVRCFIFSSTAAVYGDPTHIPISEDAPRHPVNPYGVTKLLLEDALEAYDCAYGLRFAALRYFNAAGADESGETGELHDPETHLIPSALQVLAGMRPQFQLFGDDYDTRDGTCVRDYIHVSDLAEAHVLALEYLTGSGASVALNLGNGRGYSNREVIREVEAVTGRSLPLQVCSRRPGDPPTLIADPQRARQLLGWEPKRSLHDMVSSAWNWVQICQRQRKGASSANSI